MTPEQSQDPKIEGAAVSEPRAKSLPFEYEDRSDGRHQRMIEEILAARAWIYHRRARGLEPN